MPASIREARLARRRPRRPRRGEARPGLAQWAVGCVVVYLGLFGIGDVVLGRYLRGGVTLVVGIALTVYLVRATAVTSRYPRDMMGVSR